MWWHWQRYPNAIAPVRFLSLVCQRLDHRGPTLGLTLSVIRRV
jgi:hypothetical protein